MNIPNNLRKELLICGLLIFCAVASFFAFPRAGSDGLLHAYFLDVGQGDAIFIQAPNGNQLLIDGGPDASVIRELSDIMRASDHSIDAVLSTHQDADHLTGLINVLNRYTVGRAIASPVQCITELCSEWERIIAEKKIRKDTIASGFRVNLGIDTYLEILYPPSESADVKTKNTNTRSVVARLVYRDAAILLPADIEASTEKRLARQSNLSAQFIKIAHHGSKTSSTEIFLNAVRPLAAFIEVGAKNAYGHPSRQIIQRLESMPNLVYYRTDINGRIELVSDGRRYMIKSKK